MTEWNNILTKSINTILNELNELDYIRQYAPKIEESIHSMNSHELQECNDNLLSFKRLYYDAYRFISKYVAMGKMDYVLTLYPRHIYWSITASQLNYIIMFINNGSEIELIRYLIDIGLPNNNKIHDRYIWLLGQEKLQYINLKNDECDNVN